MHIAHVIEPMEHGVFVWVIDMANRLVEEGYEVTVLHSIRKETPKNWRELFDDRVNLVHVQMTRSINPIKDLKALIKLTKELNRVKPDIIHTHSSKGGFLARVSGFLLRENKRLLYTSHAIHYPLIKEPVRRFLYKALEHVGYALGGKIVACGKEEYEIILKEITFGNKRHLLRISNGIDISQITPKDTSVKNKKIKAGVVGRISLQKAPDVFASVAKRINAERDDVEFIWIGGGEDEDVAMLNAAGVSVTGMLDRDEAINILSSLDVFFQTSAYEGLSLALLEAHAAGIPAVVTKIPGNDEVVQHEQTGFVSVGEDKLYINLSKLLDDEKLRLEMGVAAKTFTKENFSLKAMADQYIKEYKAIVAEHGKKSA